MEIKPNPSFSKKDSIIIESPEEEWFLKRCILPPVSPSEHILNFKLNIKHFGSKRNRRIISKIKEGGVPNILDEYPLSINLTHKQLGKLAQRLAARDDLDQGYSMSNPIAPSPVSTIRKSMIDSMYSHLAEINSP